MTEQQLHSRQIQLLSDQELQLRLSRIKQALTDANADSALLATNSAIYYITGRVFNGYVYIHVDDPQPYYIIRSPHDLMADKVLHMHKFADLTDLLNSGDSISRPKHLGLELDALPYSIAARIIDSLYNITTINISGAMRNARAVKTPLQIQLMRESGARHSRVYKMIPHVYRPGMTDIELQIEIERLARLEGCLGIFRVNGTDMEIFMGSVLTGENADIPTPYDFAMGGAGLDPSLPVGADGSPILPHKSVMVDINGNFTGYMSDMTRCFAVGDVAAKVEAANQLSIDIVDAITEMARPGVEASTLYHIASEMVEQAGMSEYFMGHHKQAGFVGHGLGIEINEAPVLAPRSRDILQAGNAIAIEPKFVIPGEGAVGIEDTIIVGNNSPAEVITTARRSIVNLE